MAKVGVLTGGGDCPGLNPAIRAIVRSAANSGDTVLGFKGGWKGILKNETIPLSLDAVDELLVRGGTVLGTSRTNPYKEDGGPEKVKASMKANRLDALIAIGGEDTLGVAAKLAVEGLPLVGLPKTIDNDLDVTTFTLGFPTAVEIVVEAMDRLRTTAQSHDRIMIVEIMGRHAGWLTTYGGIAGGADMVLVPEHATKVKDVIDVLQKCRKRGKNYSLIAIAEGARLLDDKGNEITRQSGKPVDAFGHVQLGGIGDLLKAMIEEKTGFDTRSTNLGHTQRGGPPSAFDRVLSTAFGVKAWKLVKAKKYGKMPALVGGKIEAIPLQDAVAQLKTLSKELYELAKVFFG